MVVIALIRFRKTAALVDLASTLLALNISAEGIVLVYQFFNHPSSIGTPHSGLALALTVVLLPFAWAILKSSREVMMTQGRDGAAYNFRYEANGLLYLGYNMLVAITTVFVLTATQVQRGQPALFDAHTPSTIVYLGIYVFSIPLLTTMIVMRLARTWHDATTVLVKAGNA
jgi:hypothetical protein